MVHFKIKEYQKLLGELFRKSWEMDLLKETKKDYQTGDKYTDPSTMGTTLRRNEIR